MKMKKTAVLKPRNPLAVAARLRQAGAHRRNDARQEGKRLLWRELDALKQRTT